MESIPRKIAIVRANRYVVDHVDYLIAYAWHPASNARELVEYAKRRVKKGSLFITVTSIEKLSSSRRPGGAEVNLAKRYPEVTFTNITAALDLTPPVIYNTNALPMCRIGQR